MGILNVLKRLFGAKYEVKVSEAKNGQIYPSEGPKEGSEIHSIWDFLQFNDNTQAFHLSSVIRFDEWVSMEEIRRRIMELFHIDYKNERSLYPYLKTMVDLGLIEMNNIGGKRKWRKRDLIIKLKTKKDIKVEEEQKVPISAENP